MFLLTRASARIPSWVGPGPGIPSWVGPAPGSLPGWVRALGSLPGLVRPPDPFLGGSGPLALWLSVIHTWPWLCFHLTAQVNPLCASISSTLIPLSLLPPRLGNHDPISASLPQRMLSVLITQHAPGVRTVASLSNRFHGAGPWCGGPVCSRDGVELRTHRSVWRGEAGLLDITYQRLAGKPPLMWPLWSHQAAQAARRPAAHSNLCTPTLTHTHTHTHTHSERDIHTH